jgi:CubicO group peptidase (beta-lactamase class C family)
VKHATTQFRPITFLVVICIVPFARADDLTPKFERYMDASVKIDHFSGSVLVSRDGEILFSKGYGLANREHNAPNTPETKFRLGSITKQFTAMAIMILVDQGKIKLGDSIGKYLDDAPKTWETIIVHHLLTHTSGIPSYTSDPEYRKKMTMPETVKSMIARFKDKPLDFRPGEKFSYSNSGYFLLGAIIEKVSKISYEVFLKQAIFEPLGMTDSGYDQPSTIIEHRASGYEPDGDRIVNASYLDMRQPYAAGSLYSTVLDLAKWDRGLSAGKFISKESYAKMYTPVKNDYAYGWAVATTSGRKRFGHGGGINGFVTQILRFPDQKVCVVVLCNMVTNSPAKVANSLAAIALGDSFKVPVEHKVVKVDPKIYDAYVGRYQLGPDLFVNVIREGDRLLVEFAGQPRLEIFPESATQFFVKNRDLQFNFVKDPHGNVTQLIVERSGEEQKGKRVEKDEAKLKAAAIETNRLRHGLLAVGLAGIPTAPGVGLS